MKITSTLETIASQVFQSSTLEEAKSICLNHLEGSKIKESDRLKMISEIERMESLLAVQRYLANALLKYEGLSDKA